MSKAAVLVGIAIAAALLAGPGTAHGVSDDQATALVEGGHLAYLKAGAVHMLTGYDHLLFLFGVMFFLTTFRDIEVHHRLHARPQHYSRFGHAPRHQGEL